MKELSAESLGQLLPKPYKANLFINNIIIFVKKKQVIILNFPGKNSQKLKNYYH
jgi:hypothetical protein